ncbi:unnamed protein product [Macrosiphum euphorbiae]|uniref:Uncharacterized protein n=1 Tax=Macrosiphum euphorbiae TaxID=13131 RepID=A0AAV0WDM2_9HEMI|nr:unnamed protein product [Macrosiphum euphorbiae]
MKCRPVSDERFVMTNKMYPAPKRIMLHSGLIAEVLGIDPYPSDCENHNDLITLYSHYSRCSAGSDNYCNNDGQSCGRRNSQPVNIGRPSRPVFRDQNAAQSAQPVRSGCPYRPDQPRIQDRPVDLFGPSPARISRSRRSTYDVQPPRCGDQNARRGTYDVEPEPQGSRRGTYDVPQPYAALQQNDRRGTYDVPQPYAALQQNDRRGTYNVSQPCPALQQNDRRGTYDVSQPCPALQQNNRRGTYDVSQPCPALQRNTCSDVQPQPERTSNCGGSGGNTFTVTGTFQLLDGFQGLSTGRQPPRGQSSSANRLHDTDGDINDYLDNHQDVDMVAPRCVAVPGQPYVDIDESDANTTPDNWRLTLGNRHSLGSQGLGILSPVAYDHYNSGSRDTSGRGQWPSIDRQSYAVWSQRFVRHERCVNATRPPVEGQVRRP